MIFEEIETGEVDRSGEPVHVTRITYYADDGETIKGLHRPEFSEDERTAIYAAGATVTACLQWIEAPSVPQLVAAMRAVGRFAK